jgi:ferredoxin-NADP reductase
MRVADVVEETDHARSFVLAVPDEHDGAFRYEAGQFLTLRTTIDGVEQIRCYSMSSAPAIDDVLRITVKRQDGGVVSTWMTTRVQAGDELEVLPPSGSFTLRPGTGDVLLFASGSGITPVLSLIKTFLVTTDRKVRLLYGNQNREAVIFHGELASLLMIYRHRFSVQHHLYDDKGYVTSKDVSDFLLGSPSPDAYICGAPEFADVVLGTLAAVGLPADRTFVESFIAGGDAPGERPEVLVETSAVTEEVVLKLRGRRHTMSYTVGETILETARRAGLSPPFSCEAGTCASCMASVKKGEVVMAFNSALSADEVADGWVLTCQSYPASERVLIEYPD